MSDLHAGGVTQPSGSLAVLPIRGIPKLLDRGTVRRLTDPRFANTEEAADWRSDNCRMVRRQARPIIAARKLGVPSLFGSLYLRKFDARENVWHDLGLASLRVVTDTGVAFLVDAFQNLVELENMKFHGTGTGTTAEAQTQSALVTEATTSLNPDSTRATGTTTETSANIYQTVATNTYDATVAITEHGIFSQAATGGGVMLDRSVFSAVNLVSGDSLQTDYRLTIAANG